MTALIRCAVVALAFSALAGCSILDAIAPKPKAKACGINEYSFRADSLPDTLVVKRCP